MTRELYLSAEEASEKLGALGIPVTARTLKDRAALGGERKVPSYKMNGKRRFLLTELLAHFEGGGGGGGSARVAQAHG